MHYRHHFHAANFADVFKHSVLCGLLVALNRKATPWCYLETHAGAGAYRLDGAEAQQSPEWQAGLARIWRESSAPEPIATYLRLVQAFQPGISGNENAIAEPVRYPGSPLFAAQLSRPGDRIVVCERVAAVAEELRMAVSPYPQVSVHQRDGYELAALLPPTERRGLVMIDPPFEHPDEFGLVADLLLRAKQRFNHGVYAIWYPLKKRFDAGRFIRRVAREASGELLQLEFAIAAPADGRMQACGMLIVNPPYEFQQTCGAALAWLQARLARDNGANVAINRWQNGDLMLGR